jgi:hypothetical protein
MKKTPPIDDHKAPLLGSWNTWYLLVIVFLIGCIAVFYWFTKHFS